MKINKFSLPSAFYILFNIFKKQMRGKEMFYFYMWVEWTKEDKESLDEETFCIVKKIPVMEMSLVLDVILQISCI